METHNAINFANYIFDYNGWSSSIKEFTVDYVDNRDGRWFCGLSCIVKVSLKDGTFHEVRTATRQAERLPTPRTAHHERLVHSFALLCFCRTSATALRPTFPIAVLRWKRRKRRRRPMRSNERCDCSEMDWAIAYTVRYA